MKLPRPPAAALARALAVLFCVALLLAAAPRSLAAPLSQTDSGEDAAMQLLARLTPEERVGQLFLVAFRGVDVGQESQIYDLIVNHHVSGVILAAENDNFTAAGDTLIQLQKLTSGLQLSRWNAAQALPAPQLTGTLQSAQFVPLLVGVSQEGDGYPFDQMLTGVTPLPNAMALGATWDPALAQQTGQVMGSELASLGINLLLGPSLDVLELPRLEPASYLSTRTFGGDPFWVGEMGRAYITGVHGGSQGRVAVIARNFPGNGGADRPPDEEVATVRKSLDQLVNFDLQPFFAVTGGAQAEQRADGLLTAHIRYQGFQGNIRATTRPVSFDPQAFSLLMSLPELASWRGSGGVIISDDLGSRAVRRFYEQTTQSYDARRVALNAFLAGNDLLYLGNISVNADLEPYTTTVRTIDFFAQKYREDPAFAQGVDASVLRILTLKARLYPTFDLQTVLPPAESLAQVGANGQVTFDVARQAATLINPSPADLDAAVPDPPDQNDRILFLTDVRAGPQCSTCPPQDALGQDALEQAVLRLYGPQSGNQVTPANLRSYAFADLAAMLDDSASEIGQALESDLGRANWVVVAMLNPTAQIPASLAFQRFLRERPDLLQQRRVIVMAFNAPYYLDSTDISKLTAYYGLYGKSPQFIDVAVRLLFRELRPEGALPVSVPGIGYDLISATSPDPAQLIPLVLDDERPLTLVTSTPGDSAVPQYQTGDLIPVRTGVILDHNGHPVPDGTPVQFISGVIGDVIQSTQVETTLGGIARSTIQVTRPGVLEARVESSDAKQSDVLRFDIPGDNGQVPPTPTPTVEPSPTPTASPTPTVTPPPAPPPAAPEQKSPGFPDWMMTLFIASLAGLLAYRLGAMIGQVRWGVRAGLMALLGGLAGYTYLAAGLPGSDVFLTDWGVWGIFWTTAGGCTAGILLTWAWRTLPALRRPGTG